ncbi:ejaculatory bulb-specific protein 3-like [Aricia agestis]|uniref:ejaculatory bulb-specific protein 3-like n=1 Tax=Aricia agestis TaxID=91739 RepID=UPI001C20A4DD|nr:ejaculatory bulb-specific protein 3-like [Aricia agestis]
MDDTLNIEAVVKDVPRFRGNLLCYVDKGPCTPQNLAYKKHFMEIVNDGCRECNDRERHMYHVFLNALKEELPTEYQEFKAKYDPDGKHFEASAKAVQAY